MEDRLSLSRTTGPGAVLDAVQSWALQMRKQRPREVSDMSWVTQHEICGGGHQSQVYLLPGPGRGGWASLNLGFVHEVILGHRLPVCAHAPDGVARMAFSG